MPPARSPDRTTGPAPERNDPGATGFMLVTAAALLLLVGLWALARNGSSAESDFAPLPAPTVAAPPARFGLPPFPTARPLDAMATAPVGARLPRRQAPPMPRLAPTDEITGNESDPLRADSGPR